MFFKAADILKTKSGGSRRLVRTIFSCNDNFIFLGHLLYIRVKAIVWKELANFTLAAMGR